MRQIVRDRYRAAVRCDCITAETRLISLGIGSQYAKARLEDFQKQLRTVGGTIVNELDFGVLVRGNVGAGKTHFLAALCREFLVQNKSIRFSLASELLRRMWNTYRDGALECPERVVDDLSTCDVLAIDDLGKGKVSDAELRLFHEIISKRNDNGRKTLVTTNLNFDEIARFYDASIASRMSCWMSVVMAGRDRRMD